MTLMGRLKGTFQALLAPAEDPRRMFAVGYERQRELLSKVQQALNDVAESKRKLQTKTADVREKLPLLQDKARQHVRGGRDDLARMALRQRRVALTMLEALEGQVREVEQEEQRLGLVEQRLTAQIEAFYAREEVIAARYSAAEAQIRINESLTGVSRELADLGAALQQAEQKTEHMQARASAIDQLIDAGVLELAGGPHVDQVEAELAHVDVGTEVDRELEALRSELTSDAAEGAGTHGVAAK